MEKKGVSTVVATVLILLITISAFAILSQFLIPYVKSALADAGDCKDYEHYFSIQETIDDENGVFNYNCYDNSKNNLTGISIRGKAELKDKLGNLKGFQVVLKNDSTSTSFRVIDGEITPQVWVAGDYPPVRPLKIPQPNDIITYVYNGTQYYNNVEVYAIVKTGKVCNIASKISIDRCVGVNLL